MEVEVVVVVVVVIGPLGRWRCRRSPRAPLGRVMVVAVEATGVEATAAEVIMGAAPGAAARACR